ncbi:ATP-dependent DNA helicase [Mycoplasmopsis verecunda]|uniref:Exodeoxyribonuclease V alpha subunit n=1 Tax=Mycoplasmopsis verecunda TaxID=171291 RepID=A0A1T4LPK6_9BACT|nr:AAA family ATPase [Mycoplasmopsis verecunda]WPB54541.1 AAA family ATPase [Mycoplasmopsis verecunda]SJZ56603.1 exodeoxyribonuclease V alpha subunit [Mycoplasmopsis verecunda]
MAQSIFKGKFVKILSGSKEEGWAFLLFKSNNSNMNYPVYCRSNVPDLFSDYEITVTESAKNKNSFILSSFVPIIEKKDINWEDFISKNVPNIGKLSAKKIIDAFGNDLFKMIDQLNEDNNEEQLLAVMTSKQLNSLVKYYQENKIRINALMGVSDEEHNNIQFFYSRNMSDLLEVLKKHHKKDDMDFVDYYKNQNPYSLYLNKIYPSLPVIDEFAIEIGWDLASINRFEAYLDDIMEQLENDNSTLMSYDHIVNQLQFIFDYDIKKIYEYLEYLVQKDRLVKSFDQKHNVYLSRKQTVDKEKFIANKLKYLNKKKCSVVLKPKKEYELDQLSENQQKGYYNFIDKNVSVVSGGPGTGKTFVIKHIYDTLSKSDLADGIDYAILAPTGRAATNITSKINNRVRTIHSFLQIANSNEEVCSEYLKKLKDIKVIVIDEFSMVDINIFDKLLNSCPSIEKIVLIGDVDQLPPIGPGDLLREIIKSKKFPVTFLNEFYRSDCESIWKHFNEIRNNGYPEFKKDEVDLCQASYQDINQKVVEIYKNKVKKYGLENVILLCPTYKGDNGLFEINRLIQNEINPKNEPFLSYKRNGRPVSFKIGDKVIQLENRLNEDICNGDIGYISDVTYTNNKNKKKEIASVEVTFKRQDNWKMTIKYTKAEFNEQVSLAYGTTIHKFQGSELDVIIFLIHPSHKRMLSKKLLYTAASRAMKNLVIVTTNDTNYNEVILRSNVYEKPILTHFAHFLNGE